MASGGQRLLGFGDASFSETDQDANSALTELDKGLRSGRLGEQCETIVRFPRLFEKYPFPILINSACLKLAEVFRVGTNFLRMLVLKVMQQSDKHLDKILNIDEFVRRIFSVMYSNDPVARALTLRSVPMLIAEIVAERKNLHHSIRSSLDSHDAVELDAAIFAAARFAAESKTFAANMCGRIGAMIQGLATPVDVKLKLLGVLENMRQDAQTASAVRATCLALLPTYPSQQFVTATLRVLTRLAASSVTDIPHQIETLIHYLSDDPREGVKAQALDDLCHLARERPHLWDTASVDAVVQYSLTTPYLNLKCGALSVLVLLAQSVAVDKFDLLSGTLTSAVRVADDKVLRLCRESIFHHNVRLASGSIRLLTHLAIHAFTVTEGVDLMQEVSSAIETLLLILCTQESNGNVQALRACLQCIVLLCETDPDLCSQFVDVLGSFLSFWSGAAMLSVCEGLCALGSRRCGVLSRIEPRIKTLLRSQAGVQQPEPKALVRPFPLSTLKRATNAARRRNDCVCPLDPWSAYRVARQATRYGHFSTAAPLFASLANKVSSEHLHFWLVSLGELSKAEESLTSRRTGADASQGLTAALTHYVRGVSALKAATTPGHSLQFQAEYVRLRCETVRAHGQLVQACACLRTAPPPAIAGSVATATRDELQKCGRVLRKCSRDFRALADQYGVLYQTLFDADQGTLRNIFLLCSCPMCLMHGVYRLSLFLGQPERRRGGVAGAAEWDAVAERTQAPRSCTPGPGLVQGPAPGQQPHPSGTVRYLQELVLVPLCLPRYFFQSLQSTSIKLAVSPQQKASGDPLFLAHQTQLALRVEGVVQHGARGPNRAPFRSVHKVLVTVTTAPGLPNAAGTSTQRSAPQDSKVRPSSSASPHNDYFQAQFLLCLPAPGLHTVTVDTSVLDAQHSLWKTGPQVSLTVKCHDDAKPSSSSTASTAATQGMVPAVRPPPPPPPSFPGGTRVA
ncbi:integrator complex subunit, putative [Ixodes scapularis]|uniref:Integrator complex subunit 7 n=1 Tax=Ixodes scapularis TaxID=6945 RepID=B7P0P4_IXOSC|nr:integrator complex subunit, putative [Ixodes scapularis]|eukprot:XP_002399325.1 integrator complex subunit, putative [Ixodes scapularis]